MMDYHEVSNQTPLQLTAMSKLKNDKQWGERGRLIYIGREERVSRVVEVGKRRAGVHNGGELHRHSLAVHGDRSDTDVVVTRPAN